MKKISLSQEREARLRQFWPLGRPIKLLAAEWHCTVGYISTQAKELGLPPRQARSVSRINTLQQFATTIDSRRYFDEAASSRGMHPRELESLLISVVCNDRLIDAILDDANEDRQAA